MGKLRIAITALASGGRLDAVYQDHPLRGVWRGHRELHIGPDWLLIYKIVDDELRLVRTGRHVDLFQE